VQQQGDKRDPFGLLGPAPKKRDDDPFGLLGGEKPSEPATASTGALPDTGDIDLGSGGDRPAGAKPDAGPPPIMRRDLAPVVRTSAARARAKIGSWLDKAIGGDAYQRNTIPRAEPKGPAPVPHKIATVSIPADPQKVTRHLDHLDPITQVFANTEAGVDTPAPGAELPFNEDAYQEYRGRLLEEYNNPTTPDLRKKEVVRTLGQMEKQRSEAIALRREDPISAAGRTATFGALQTPERYAIRREHEADIESGRAVTPEELRATRIIREGDAVHKLEPGATAGQNIGELAGTILPFEAGERTTMYGVKKLADALEVGIPRARTISEALRFAESPVTATTEFGQGAQTLAKRAIRGQAGFATISAGEAIKHDQNVPEAVAKGIVPGVVMGTLLGGAADLLEGGGSMARDLAGLESERPRIATGSDYAHLQTGARIAEATHMIDATRPDKTPISDKMPEAQQKVGSAIAALLESRRVEEARAAAVPAEEAPVSYEPIQRRRMSPAEEAERYGSESNTFEGRARHRRWTDWHNLPEEGPPAPREVWTQEQRDAFHEQRLQEFRNNPNAWTPPEHPDVVAEQFRRGASEPFPYQLREQAARDAQVESAPPEPQITADNFDMSKNMERMQAEQAEQEALAQQAQVVAQSQPPGEEPPPANPQERLARARAKFAEIAGKVPIAKEDIPKIAFAGTALAGAAATDDENKRAALLGAAALTTGRVHEGEVFHSRLVNAIDAMPKAWEQPRPAADWLGKLSAGGQFAKEEFNYTLKDFLEKAKAEKRKLTKAEVLEHAEMNRPRLDVERRTPGGVDLESPAKEPPPTPPKPQPRELDPDDIPGAIRGEGQATLQVRHDRAEAEREARDRFESVETELTYRREQLETATANAGIPDAQLQRVLERYDDGDGRLRVDRAIEDLMDYVDDPPGRSEPELNASWEPKKLDDGTWIIHRDYDEDVIRGRGATKLEAMADFHARYGTESLGNLRDILGGESGNRIEERPGEDEPWVMLDSDGDEVATAKTRDDLVESWVSDHYDGSEIENTTLDEVRDELQRYSTALSEYNDVESETFGLREGDEGLEEMEQRLEEARRDDEGDLQAEVDALGVAGYDLDFYRLDEGDREFVRQGIAEGAVGTRKPLLGEGYEEGPSHELVTDPNQPHVPFPQEGSKPAPPERQLPLHEPVSFPPRQPAILRASERKASKFTNSQATPGGRNYRELTMSWGNPPRTETPQQFKFTVKEENGGWHPVSPDGTVLSYERYGSREAAQKHADNYSRDAWQTAGGAGWRDYVEDHWGGDPPNTAVHTRFDERTYTGGQQPHPEVQKLLNERNDLGKRQTDIAAKLQEMVDQVGDDPAKATPEMHALAQEYRYLQEKIGELDGRYTAAVEAGYGPGTYREIATNLIEAQSDWYQVGEVGGYSDPKPMSEARRTEINEKLASLADETSRLQRDEQEFNRQWRESPEYQRVQELRTKEYNYTLTGPEQAEINRLRDDQSKKSSEYREKYFDRMNKIEEERQALNDELRKKRLLPGEKERVAAGRKKAQDKYTEARQAYNVNPNNENRAAMEVAERRASRYTYATPVPDMPWKDPQAVFGLAAASLLKEAVEANSDLATWSHSTNRMSGNTARLPKAAAELTYDNALVTGVKKLLKGLGFDVTPEVIEMDGYKHWSVRLTPEMKAKIKKSSFPILSALALLGAPSVLKAEDGGDDKPSVIPYLIAAGLAAGVWKSIPRDMRARLVSRVKAEGIRKPEPGKPAEPAEYQAIRIMRRGTGAAAATAAAVIAADQTDRNISDMTIPLSALAVLAAIGSKNLALGRDAIGKTLVEQLRKTNVGEDAVRFLNPDALLTPEVRQAVLDYEQGRSKGKARAKELSGKAEALGPQGDRAVSDVIEKETTEDTSQMKPEDVEAVLTVAAQIAKEFEDLTAQKVKLGVLKKHEAIPDYMPRKYAYWEALDVMRENPRPASIRPGARPRIKGSKPRTIEKGDIEARTKLGEIREASYRTATGIEEGYADVAAAQLFKTIRAAPGAMHPEYLAALDDFLAAKDLMRQAKLSGDKADMATAEAMLDKAALEQKRISDRFRLKGGDYVTLPGSRGFGVLRDAVVQRDVANSLNGIPEIKKVDKFMRFWKQSKTVFNPGTGVANVLSNTVMSHMAGMRLTEQPFWLVRAARDMRKYGDATRALAEAGILDQNAVTAGSGGMGETARSAKSERGLEKLKKTTRPETAKVLGENQIDETTDHFPTFRKVGQAARDLYNNEDNIFRVAMYLKARQPADPFALLEGSGFGMGPESAIKHVQGTFGNFRTRSPALRVLRGSLSPFILYTAKAVPAFAKQIVDHPIRYMTLIAAWGALDQYSKSEVGDIPESDIEERDRRKWGYFFPGFVQLPFTNTRGDKAMEDLSRWTPMSGVTDVAQPGVTASQISPKWPRALTPSGPATDIYSKFYGNIDTYTGDRRYSIEKPMKRNIGQALEDVGDIALPAALSFHRRRLVEDFANQDFDALRTDLPGLAGLRPRYIRPGSVQMSAGFSMEKALQDAKSEATRALARSKSPDQDEKIIKQYYEYVDQIQSNFQHRVSPER
jgi:hypothetical protein